MQSSDSGLWHSPNLVGIITELQTAMAVKFKKCLNCIEIEKPNQKTWAWEAI